MYENRQADWQCVPQGQLRQYDVPNRIQKQNIPQGRGRQQRELQVPDIPQGRRRQRELQVPDIPQGRQRQQRQRVPQGRRNVTPIQRRQAQQIDYQMRKQQMRQRQIRLQQQRKKKFRRQMMLGTAMILFVMLVSVGTFLYVFSGNDAVPAVGNVAQNNAIESSFIFGNKIEKPEIEENFLTVSEYNRPGEKLSKVKNIFVHYTANKGTSAAQNRSYFESLGETHERGASAHFIIGYEGEIIQCIPLDEEAYAVIGRNEDSISIECCYLDEDGSFTQETYDSLVHMLAWLVSEYHLKPDDILRHYDSNGKMCPVYYVEHENEWEQLKRDVAAVK